MDNNADIFYKNMRVKDVHMLLDIARDKKLEIESTEGTLLDNYLIENNKTIKINGQPRDFIVVRETFLSYWESGYSILLTNDPKVEKEFES